jgi:hypothetical protein
MSDWDENEKQDEATSPDELCRQAFSRCSNWPTDRAGQIGLAQGLAKAAGATGQTPQAIINRCAAGSAWCPTDADLFTVAYELQEEARQAAYKAQARPESTRGKTCPYLLCDGTGWRQVCHLHTHHGGDDSQPAWVDKEIITREQYETLQFKVDWVTQMVYESRYRCKCHPPREVEDAPKRPRRSSMVQAGAGCEAASERIH